MARSKLPRTTAKPGRPGPRIPYAENTATKLPQSPPYPSGHVLPYNRNPVNVSPYTPAGSTRGGGSRVNARP